MLPKVRTKSKVKEHSFNFNFSEMKKAVSSPKNRIPRIKDVKDLDAWLNS